MSKDTNISGNSVFGQLISIIPTSIISKVVLKTQSDRYTKKFITWEHLITMLFCTASNLDSLRNVCNGLQGLEGKLVHLNIKSPVKKSTLSDANAARNFIVFEQIYFGLLDFFKPILSDSRYKVDFGKQLSIIDSTTISLFKDILNCTGRKPKDGKEKGGIKAHMQVQPDYNSPTFLHFTDATKHDSHFLDLIDYRKDQIYVFDRAYNDYERFEYFIKNDISFVTRLKHNATFKKQIELELDVNTDEDILLDEIIQLPIKIKGKVDRSIQLRRVVYWDEAHNVCYEFISNIYDLKPEQIAKIYKCRWAIELLFKQLKQNQTLQYFLGDNENAIKIQIWCSLIWNLILTVIQRQLKSKRWAFSNLVSVIRVHIFNYINLIKFLENPDRYYTCQAIKSRDLFSP